MTDAILNIIIIQVELYLGFHNFEKKYYDDVPNVKVL